MQLWVLLSNRQNKQACRPVMATTTTALPASMYMYTGYHVKPVAASWLLQRLTATG